VGGNDTTLQRMDNVLIVIEDLEAAKAFFAELGIELEGETKMQGPSLWAQVERHLPGGKQDKGYQTMEC
jgi:hypothetical protein